MKKASEKHDNITLRFIAVLLLSFAVFLILICLNSEVFHRLPSWLGWLALILSCALPALGVALLYRSASIRAKRLAAEKEKLLKREAERFHIIYENTSVNIWDYDFKTRQIRQTEKSVLMHGHDIIVENVPESLVNSGYVHADYAESFLQMYDKLFAGEPHAEGVFLVQNGDRTKYWYEHIRYQTLFDASGKPYAAIGMSTDETADEERKIMVRQWAELLSGASNERTTIYEYNLSSNQFVRKQGLLLPDLPLPAQPDFNQCAKMLISQFVEPEDQKIVSDLLDRNKLLTAYLDGKFEMGVDYRARLGQDEVKWVSLTVKLAKYPSENAIRAVVINTDIDERKRDELELLSKAQTDPLTGVLNREIFALKLNEIVALLPNVQHALIMVDMDNFKEINDTLGHMAGDQVLLKVASSLQSLLRSGDLVGRIGGDEFMVFLKNVPNVDVIKRRAELINDILCEELPKGITSSGSLGIALYPRDGMDFEQLYRSADAAAYNAKKQSKNCYRFFNSLFSEAPGTLTSPIDALTGDDELDETRKQQIDQVLTENQKLIERQEEDERYRIIMERTNIISFEWNANTNVSHRSSGFSEYVLSQQDARRLFSENADLSGIHPDDRALFYGKFLEKLLCGEAATEIVLRLKLTDGTFRWCRLGGIVISDATERPYKYIGILMTEDIQKIQSKVQLDAIVKFISAGVLLLEIKGRTISPLFVSESFYKMDSAIDRVDFGGNALKHVYQDDVHDLLLKLQISAQSGEPVEHSFRVIRGNHVCKRRIKAVRVPYEDNPNPVMIAVEEDAGCQAETDARLNSDASMPVNAEAISRAAAAHPSIRGDE